MKMCNIIHFCFCILPLLSTWKLEPLTSVYFLHTEDVRLGIEHAVSIEDVSAAYPLLDVIDLVKSQAAVCIFHSFIQSFFINYYILATDVGEPM